VWLYVNGRKVTAIVEQFFDVRGLWMQPFFLFTVEPVTEAEQYQVILRVA
jgi:hypothetical protein